MSRVIIPTLALFITVLLTQRLPAQEIVDPAKAKKDPDFAVQGEYLGKGTWPGGKVAKIGAQVIARSNHEFRVVLYRGGLPGDGWQRGDERLFMDGEWAEGTTTLTGKELPAGEIAEGEMTVEDREGNPIINLKRIERKSPTLDAEPPEDAVVLFDGTTAEKFKGGKLTEMKTLEAGCTLKEKYKIARIHLEFRLSWKPQARGQGRSNSGVYIDGIPEIQVLDSFGLEGKKNECGAFYGKRRPDVNMCLPPLVWQTYDVAFTRPDPEGNILVTVRHNGVVIHEDYDTGQKEVPKRGLHLQRHGNRVQYRNIWLVKPE